MKFSEKNNKGNSGGRIIYLPPLFSFKFLMQLTVHLH